MVLWGLLVLGGKVTTVIQCSEQEGSGASLRGSIENKTAPGHRLLWALTQVTQGPGRFEEELSSEP